VALLDPDAAEPALLEPGDRIAQLLLVKIPVTEPVEAEALSESARGDGGFGSSGR
jgi:dUTP pyrophosphatase